MIGDNPNCKTFSHFFLSEQRTNLNTRDEWREELCGGGHHVIYGGLNV